MDTLDFLSDSSSDSSNSESDNEENIAAQNLQEAFQQKIAQKTNSSTPTQQNYEAPQTSNIASNFTSILTNSDFKTSNIKNNVAASNKPKMVKKRPPAPDDISKLLGIQINEAPKKKIKKLSDVSSENIEKRAKDLENKYSWCFQEPHQPTHRTIQNPYEIDELDYPDSQKTNALDKSADNKSIVDDQSMPKSLRISKMVAVDWASSVAPPSEDLFSDQSEMRDSSYPSNSYEEYNKKKNSYQNRDNRTSNMRHRNRTTMDKKSYNDKRGVRDRSQVRLNHTSTQCPSPTHSLRLLVDASVQTSSFQPASTPSLSSEHEKLNKPDFYKAKADDMKKILTLMSDPISTLIVRLKLSLLEAQEVVSMMACRLDASSICYRINPVILACRKTLEEIKNFQHINVVLRDALTVITMKLMSFFYHNMYVVKREEIAKAKAVLDNFILRNDSKEMTSRELACMKMYATHMEYFAKSFNYVERANVVIKTHKSDFFTRHNLKELYPVNNIFRHVSVISAALIETNRIHDDEAP